MTNQSALLHAKEAAKLVGMDEETIINFGREMYQLFDLYSGKSEDNPTYWHEHELPRKKRSSYRDDVEVGGEIEYEAISELPRVGEGSEIAW